MKTVTALLLALALLAAPMQAGATLPSAPPFDGGTLEMHMRNRDAQLTVTPGGPAEIGSYCPFLVERDGQLLSYMDLTYEIVEGADCAAIYYTGNILALGEGEVVVKAWLDEDPSVFGFGRVTVVRPAQANRYTRENELLSVDCFEPLEQAFETSIAGFPTSYKPYLRALHLAHPAWIFEPFDTGLSFDEVVEAESSYDRNVTLLANVADIFKSRAAGDFNRQTGQYILKDTGWVETNAIAVSFYMDPRNYLDERAVFQFEKLTYDPAFHTQQGIEGILAGSFMENARADYLDADGVLVPADKTYGQIILEAAEESGVNPYYLAAKIRGEIGSSSPSDSANGQCPGYEGYYNFYNIGATDGEGNIQRALDWAASGDSYGKPWTSPEKAIVGGALFLAESYVGSGQDTGYLQKFNVNTDSPYALYQHQYMTNVSGAVSQAMSTYSGYESLGLLDSPLVFSIPVYSNLPAAYFETGGIAFTPTAGIVTQASVLRSGPAAFYSPVLDAPLEAGATVTILSSCLSSYDLYHSFLFYPFWYRVAVTVEGETVEGFLCAEFVDPSRLVLQAGDSLSLPIQFAGGSVRYLSDNTDVAEVSGSGTVTGFSNGLARITAYTSQGGFASYLVQVYGASQEETTLE